MPFKHKKAERTVRLLSQYFDLNSSKSPCLKTAFFANDPCLYDSEGVRAFLSLYDCLAPYPQKHPLSYLEAEEVYRQCAASLSLRVAKPLRYETVYYEFGGHEDGAFEQLSLTLPIFSDENDYMIYSPKNDTYQYGFYHYGKLREGDPMGICPSGHLLIRLETQKEKRPRMILAGDAFTPFLVPYIAHHYDICLHAPLQNDVSLSRDLFGFRPDVFLLLGGITLLESPVLIHALLSQ